MTGPEHIFWDSCVFIRHLTENPSEYVDDIARYITDAKRGARTIYFSTIAFSEIRPRHFKKIRGQDIRQFFQSWRSAFTPIEPSPDVMIHAGELRDAEPANPENGNPSSRVISAPDAIHLMTCIYIRNVLGVDDIVFQTFDRGRNTVAGEKCVPILGFERWFPDKDRYTHVKDVCDLPRQLPAHPERDLLSGGGIG